MTCERCGRLVRDPHQLCAKRTPASPFCWASDDERALEIQPGLKLRPGGGGEHPGLEPDGPYGEL